MSLSDVCDVVCNDFGKISLVLEYLQGTFNYDLDQFHSILKQARLAGMQHDFLVASFKFSDWYSFLIENYLILLCFLIPFLYGSIRIFLQIVGLLYFVLKKVCKCTGKLIVRYRLYMNDFHGTQQYESDRSYSPERMKPGSTFYPQDSPQFQCELYALDNTTGIFMKMGQAWRFKNFIVTAAHNLPPTADVIRFLRKDNHIDVNRNKFEIDDDLDLANIELTTTQFNTLGLCQAKVGKLGLLSSTFTHVAAFGQASVGTLEPGKTFGMVNYDGSTISGYSGAPYYLHKTVYGMHLGAGSTNLGLDANYIARTLMKKEATEDYLIQQIGFAKKMNKKIKVRQSGGDPREWMVQLPTGEFIDTYVEKRPELQEILEELRDNSHSSYNGESSRLFMNLNPNKYTYDDETLLVTDSKNELSPPHVSVGETSSMEVPIAPNPRKTRHTSRKTSRDSSRESTSCRHSTRAPKRDLSNSTLKDTLVVLLEHSVQQQRTLSSLLEQLKKN